MYCSRIFTALPAALAIAVFAACAEGAADEFRRLPPTRAVRTFSQGGDDFAPARNDSHPQPRRLPLIEPPTGGKHDGRGEVRLARAEPRASTDPWWYSAVQRPLRSTDSRELTLEQLIFQALQNSPRVQALGDAPLARQTRILEEEAAFDVKTFIDSRLVRTNDPVGNTLTTGGPPRFRDSDLSTIGGIRKRNPSGGAVELSQRLGYQDNNSVFFVPTQQGNARLTLSFTQPLLSGAGRSYNSSFIVLAQIEADAAWDDTLWELQGYLVDVARVYWQLYRQRSVAAQRQRLHREAEEILNHLERRRAVDALGSQVARAQAAVATRQAGLIRAQADIRNLEVQLKALVGEAPAELHADLELIPAERPDMHFVQVDLQQALEAAMQFRPDVDQAMQQIRAANVRLAVSENELLPELNLIAETYLSGLEGNSRVAGAMADQFSAGEPGFTLGLRFETPMYRRAAQARHQRRRLELRQLTAQFELTLQRLAVEVEVAAREIETAHRQMGANLASVRASETEVRFLTERWRLLPGDDRSASFLLEDLLNAQERRAHDESAVAEAQVNYALAVIHFKRATGRLLEAEQITPAVMHDGELPRVFFEKNPVHPHNP